MPSNNDRSDSDGFCGAESANANNNGSNFADSDVSNGEVDASGPDNEVEADGNVFNCPSNAEISGDGAFSTVLETGGTGNAPGSTNEEGNISFLSSTSGAFIGTSSVNDM